MKRFETCPDYEEVSRALRATDIAISAAEAHGIICGSICVPDEPQRPWQTLIFGTEEAPEHYRAAAEVLHALHGDSHQVLHGADYRFRLLLPGEDYPLDTQVDELGAWCRGYLLGLSVAAADPRAASDDVGEFIADLVRIGEAELDDCEAEAPRERALVEIVEFVRVGVQLVFEDPRARGAAARQ